MKKIRWWSETGTVGADRDGEIEVDDSATEDEIDAAVREEVFNYFSWGWSPSDGEAK